MPLKLPWIAKAAVQKLVAVLPNSRRVNYLMQRWFTVGSLLPDDWMYDRVRMVHWHLEGGGDLHKPISDWKVLEIGTGWYPVVPILFYLAGANELHTLDVHRLYSPRSINVAVNSIQRFLSKHSDLSEAFSHFPDRIARLERILELNCSRDKFALFHSRSWICNTEEMPFDSMSFDLIISNNTFQFIPGKEIPSVIHEADRIISKEGVFSLGIDLTDEFAHSDPRIGNFHFLRYSENQWNMITSHLNRTNRLRYSDYVAVTEPYFQVVEEELTISPRIMLGKAKLHDDFKKYPKEELLVEYILWKLMKK